MYKTLILGLMLCLFALSGCYSTKQILIKNDKDSNFNLNHDAVPITIFLFQLRDTAKFKDASILDLIQRTDVVLGKDKIDVTKMQISPDQQKVIATINKKEVPYLGILAVYNNLNAKKKIKSLIASEDIYQDLLELQIQKEGIFIIGKNKYEELIK